MILLDDFLPSYDELKAFSLTCDYVDEVNPIDGVTYPHICRDIPEHLQEEILQTIEHTMGQEPEDPLLFLRASPEGCKAPHMAHTDYSMGDWSFMLYLTDVGKTSFLRHVDSGIMYQPMVQTYVETVVRHQNDPSKWEVYQVAEMKENRACIFDSGLLHCAEPIGGHGHGGSQRTVATCFFS